MPVQASFQRFVVDEEQFLVLLRVLLLRLGLAWIWFACRLWFVHRAHKIRSKVTTANSSVPVSALCKCGYRTYDFVNGSSVCSYVCREASACIRNGRNGTFLIKTVGCQRTEAMGSCE